MKTFHQKVAAITGAGSGIGQQLALLLAQQGCHLALSDVNEQGLCQTLELLKGTTVRVTRHTLDVADRAAVYAWAEQVVREHGAVHMIFNNAGVALASSVEAASTEELEWIFGINFWGVVHGSQAFLPYLKQQGEGHIINLSSLFGLTAQPSQSAYNASKFAVRGFTESLRQELDLENCGVSALCVHPGGIRTNIANAARVNAEWAAQQNGADDSVQDFNRFLRMPAQQAAQQILNAVLKNRRRVLIGKDAKLLDIIQRLFPAGYQQLFVWLIRLSRRGEK